MAIIDVNRNPSRRTLNQFGFIWLGFFLLAAGGLWLKLHSISVSATLAGVAVVAPVLGWAVPGFMRVVYLGMSYLAWPIGLMVSLVLLAAVYFLVVTPIGLVMRVLGYDPMHRRFEPDAPTYWIGRDGGARDQRSYFRQF